MSQKEVSNEYCMFIHKQKAVRPQLLAGTGAIQYFTNQMLNFDRFPLPS